MPNLWGLVLPPRRGHRAEAQLVAPRGPRGQGRRQRAPSFRQSKISKFWIVFCNILQSFGGLALGCIKTKFCNKAPANQQGFRRKIRRPNLYGEVPRPVPGRHYRTRHATDREIVALHDLKTFDLASNADTFFCMQIADVLVAPGLSRYTSRYDRVKFHRLKI